MKIGVFYPIEPGSGGAYQYQTTFLEILKKRKDDDVVIITSDKQISRKYCNDLQILDLSIVSRLFKPLKFIFSFLRKIRNNRKEVPDKGNQKINHVKKNSAIEKIYYQLYHLLLVINGIKLIIYPGPFEMSFKLNVPYVFTVYDLQHRIHPEFPEVSIDGVFEEREYLYSNALPNAVAVIADSQVGKEDIVNLYNVNQDKIFVFQHLPPAYLNNKLTLNELNNVKSNYNLPDTYIFYPANFWHHKNHQSIIKAIAILKGKNILIHAVFTGSKQDRWDGFKKAMELARDLNVIDQVHYLGYVENDEMSALYKLSVGLVMPTFFGPANIPYLEAFYLDCPVITSDIRGIREQVKDAALLVDPKSPEELAKAIVKLLNDEKLRNRLVKNGHKVLDSWTYNDFSNELNRLVDCCAKKLRKKF